MVRATTAGPAAHMPLPSSESVAVGRVMVGPTPQINFPDLAGDRNTVGVDAPRPNALGTPGAGDGWLMIGMIVRVMRFQSSFERDGDHGLDVEDVLGDVVGPDPEVEVVLEGYADEVGDRVLRLPSPALPGFPQFAPAAATGGLAGRRRQRERVVEAGGCVAGVLGGNRGVPVVSTALGL